MAKRNDLAPIKLPNGSIVYTRVESAVTTGKQGFAATAKGISDINGLIAPQSMDDVMNVVEGIATSLDGVIKKVAPQEATVEFGIEIALESGKLTALFVKGTGTADLKVSLTWKKVGSSQ